MSQCIVKEIELPTWIQMRSCKNLMYSATTFWPFSFLCATSGSCNNTPSVFVYFQNQPTFFLIIWIVESLYIQENKAEVWIHLTILTVNFILFLLNSKVREHLSHLLHISPTIKIFSRLLCLWMTRIRHWCCNLWITLAEVHHLYMVWIDGIMRAPERASMFICHSKFVII